MTDTTEARTLRQTYALHELFDLSDEEVRSACSDDSVARRDAWVGDAEVKLATSRALYDQMPSANVHELTQHRQCFESNLMMALFIDKGTDFSAYRRCSDNHALATAFEALLLRASSTRRIHVIDVYMAWVRHMKRQEAAAVILQRKAREAIKEAMKLPKCFFCSARTAHTDATRRRPQCDTCHGVLDFDYSMHPTNDEGESASAEQLFVSGFSTKMTGVQALCIPDCTRRCVCGNPGLLSIDGFCSDECEQQYEDDFGFDFNTACPNCGTLGVNYGMYQGYCCHDCDWYDTTTPRQVGELG